MDSSACGIFQVRILEQVAISYSGALSHPGIEPASLASPALAGGFFTTAPPGKPNLVVQYLEKYSSTNYTTAAFTLTSWA